MYTPSFYKENRTDLIAKLIRENSLATVISTNSVGHISVSHLPLILRNANENNPASSIDVELWGHMARANPHWKDLSSATSMKIIFNGPDSYISPAWYIEKKDNVPTWNYAVVHCTGDFEIIAEPNAALEDMKAVISEFEGLYGTNWSLALTDEQQNTNSSAKSQTIHKDVTDMLEHIVVFRFKNLKFDAKFKLAQKLDKVSRETTIAELKALGEEKTDSSLFDLAEYMELTRS